MNTGNEAMSITKKDKIKRLTGGATIPKMQSVHNTTINNTSIHGIKPLDDTSQETSSMCVRSISCSQAMQDPNPKNYGTSKTERKNK